MGNQLLIRAYNVGCGDCIYVRIPGPKDGFHILIDCGKKGGDELLEKAVEHLEERAAGRVDAGKEASRPDRRHAPARGPHQGVRPAVVQEHRGEEHLAQRRDGSRSTRRPKGVNGLHAFATQAMRGLADSGQALSPEVELLASMYGVSNDAADELLMETLPKAERHQAEVRPFGHEARI